jgi:riboflavin synthase
MFTGIIECLGTIEKVEMEGSNYHFTISSPISTELKIDQSVAHDGVCLTVVESNAAKHRVTAVRETLERTCLAAWKVGRTVNLERAMLAGGRFDGHNVQGHIDATARCNGVQDLAGSWSFEFDYPTEHKHLLVDKGSVCINGTSLTVIKPTDTHFSVAIIPYTYQHTNFSQLQKNSIVNIEFDVIGKYLARYLKYYIQRA